MKLVRYLGKDCRGKYFLADDNYIYLYQKSKCLGWVYYWPDVRSKMAMFEKI